MKYITATPLSKNTKKSWWTLFLMSDFKDYDYLYCVQRGSLKYRSKWEQINYQNILRAIRSKNKPLPRFINVGRARWWLDFRLQHFKSGTYKPHFKQNY